MTAGSVLIFVTKKQNAELLAGNLKTNGYAESTPSLGSQRYGERGRTHLKAHHDLHLGGDG
jgi:hypothetical protein